MGILKRWRYYDGSLVFGTLERDEVYVRFFKPIGMCHYDRDSVRPFGRLDWRRLFKLSHWRDALRWGDCTIGARRHFGCNRRCYCPFGWVTSGEVFVFGFGVRATWSRHGGVVPCGCDEVIRELFPDEYEEAA